jgi:two-component system, LytTR family, sensor kinase
MLGYKRPRDFVIAYLGILGANFVGFLVRLAKFDEFSFEFQVSLFLTGIVLVAITWESLRLIHLWLNRVYPFERNLTVRMVLQLALGALVGLSVRFIIYRWGEPRLPIQLDSLFIAATWAIYILMPSGVNLGFFTVYFINRWKDSIRLTERLEKEKAQVQFDNLKNQLNPHFLFNALTSLNSLIFENQQLASQFVQQLSRVYRYVLQNKDKNCVPLTTELEFISNYVKLLETRFEGALKVRFDISNDSLEKSIVPVSLQILIENAVKHNIVDNDKPLDIVISTIGNYLVVSNNLQVKKRVETSNKQGLDNLRSLYRFLIEKPVIVEQTDDRFFVKIPLIAT